MALDYSKCAREISEVIGGGKNVVSAAHCATRLRLVIADNSKVDRKKLEDVEGVKGVFESNGQLQIIIGTGTVNKVYEEFLSFNGLTAATKDDVKAAAAQRQPVWKQMLKALGDVFVPILPAIVASGLMMGIVEALGKAVPGFAQTDWYAFLDTVSNTAFAFLPVIVAISAARVFGGNIFLGAVIGLLMVHTAFINGWSVGSTETINSFFGVTDGVVPKWHLIGDVVTIRRAGYQGHVIPVIIAVWLMCRIEKWLHKHVPEMIDLFVTPLTTVFTTALLALWIIGPIFAQLESWVLLGAEILVKNPIGAAVMGAVYPWTVVMGLHHMYNVIEAGMLASVGLNTWMPIASAANFAQFGACLAVGIKAHNNKTRVIAVPSSMSAALGITEPAIFGVNMRFFKPFICAMIAGAVGALFGAVSRIGATAYGVTGIPGYLTIDKPLQYTILLLISGGLAFLLVWFIWKEGDAGAKQEAAAGAEGDAAAAPVSEVAADAAEQDALGAMELREVMTSEAGALYAPVRGRVIPAEQIPDETFAGGVLGQGVGIEPEEETVYAPCDGTISSVAETGHAIGISAAGDQELLIHVGVDTVKMGGKGFRTLVAEGDAVKRGQKLLTFDRAAIREAGYPDVVVFLLTNSDDYKGFKVTGV
ncbi:PTS beta-glucoside transporter subunit IIBCA [Lachnoclostridium sp. Marseille-P6806]|uniref:PTS beta-glucoside transporter subunit IIBCA n=1 Tax=Lachnoclostridium sp. Marseille-P6806 TaxID=2364793 RepID=UPI001030F684|nr:PTS transporter subunit IIBCA [Lachnoclostridium sp. Marseille-P6806]